MACSAVSSAYTPLVEAQIEGQAKAHGIAREQVIRDACCSRSSEQAFRYRGRAGRGRRVSSAATASITGVALPVDGGWTAH
jgi:3-hydroxybutyrate dehydrogenase